MAGLAAASTRGVSSMPLPNKRLKLAAPGLGRIPFVRQRTAVPHSSIRCARQPGPAAYARSVRRPTWPQCILNHVLWRPA